MNRLAKAAGLAHASAMADSPKTTIDASEIAKFEAMAEEWWDPQGKFKPLHRFNPTRIEYIRNTIAEHVGTDPFNEPLRDLSLLDIGCGGGLLCEPMCRLGANVTGLDASEKNIRIASVHADKQELDITYQAGTAEALAGLDGDKRVDPKRRYQIVLAMEIVEHVADVPLFIEACCRLVKPGGLLFMATINRTVTSLLTAKIGAEYILRWLPKGTHEWNKFLRPSELVMNMEPHGVQLKQLQGVTYQPLSGDWKLSDNLAVNYMVVGHKA